MTRATCHNATRMLLLGCLKEKTLATSRPWHPIGLHRQIFPNSTRDAGMGSLPKKNAQKNKDQKSLHECASLRKRNPTVTHAVSSSADFAEAMDQIIIPKTAFATTSAML